MALTIDRTRMNEVPSPDTVEPFGKINYEDKADGSGRVVRATILMDNVIENSRMGIAIDGSASMEPLFGKKPLSAFIPAPPNHVKPAAQAMSAYLAKKAGDGRVTVIYWATGAGGNDIQVLGDMTPDEAQNFGFDPPGDYGTGTRLMPALNYFLDGKQRPDLYDAPWGMYVFITDGQVEDMDAVKQFCMKLAKDIEAGRRNDVKLVIIGLGDQVDEDQLDELDDLETGTSVDLWDSKLAAEMEKLSEIFAEVVDEADIVVPGDGIVKDESGNTVVDYRDTGLPAVLLFKLSSGAKSFSLEVGGNTVTQPLP